MTTDPSETPKAPAASSPPPQEKPEDSLPTGVAYVLVLSVSVVLLLVTQQGFGLWEPWETGWAESARSLSESGQWFHPTFDGKTAPRPLLPLWFIALGQSLGGGETLMRLPMTLLVIGACMALFTWLRAEVGNLRGALATLAAVASPMVFLSGATMVGNGAFVGSLMLSMSLYGLLQRKEEGKVPAALALGLGGALSLSVLSLGLWGLWIPLGIASLVGVSRATAPGTILSPRKKLQAGAVLFGGMGLVLGTATIMGSGVARMQVLTSFAPLSLFVAAFFLSSHTRAVQLFKGTAGLMALLPPLTTLAITGALFSAQVPADDTYEGIQLLRFLSENHLVTADALPEHVDFDFWVRQIGFASFPWTVFLPMGVVWALRPFDPKSSALGATLFAWFLVSMLSMFLLGTVHEHYLFPSSAAASAMVGLMLTDKDWWKSLRDKPLLLRALGFVTILPLMFLGKDLDRYPGELLGALLTDGEFTTPEDFDMGRSLKVLRYGLLVLVGVYFFDPIKILTTWVKSLRLKLAPVRKMALLPRNFALIFSGGALCFALLTGFHWVPELSYHLSQKGILETYEEMSSEGETLMTYRMGSSSASFYLDNVEKISNLTGLKSALKREDRVFIVLPRNNLSKLNYEVRKAVKDRTKRKNIHIVDKRSNRYILASNQLKEGEQEYSPVAHAILPGRPKPIFSTVVKDEEGVRQYPQFDGRVQMLGYELYHEDEVNEWGEPTEEAKQKWAALQKKGETPVFKTGETVVIRYFFKVLKRMPSGRKIFLHVDYPRSRINGDHEPVEGLFPTEHWLAGDYIVDTQRLAIEQGSTNGIYKLFAGFFKGSDRMKIEPPAAHDGSNRVRLGQIEVKTF